MKKSWLVEKAEINGKLIGVKIKLVIDNSPIKECFENIEARKNGFCFQEPKTEREILREDVKKSSKRMKRFF